MSTFAEFVKKTMKEGSTSRKAEIIEQIADVFDRYEIDTDALLETANNLMMYLENFFVSVFDSFSALEEHEDYMKYYLLRVVLAHLLLTLVNVIGDSVGGKIPLEALEELQKLLSEFGSYI